MKLNKIRNYAIIGLTTMYLNTDKILAENPTFDTAEAKGAIKPYLESLQNFLLWFVPLAFVISALVSGVKYFFMDEREREQKPITKTLSKLGISALIIWSIPLIASIIGLKN